MGIAQQIATVVGTTDQIETVLGKKSYLVVLENAVKSFIQRVICVLADIDPMIPLLLWMLILRESSSIDRNFVLVGLMLTFLFIEEVV